MDVRLIITGLFAIWSEFVQGKISFVKDQSLDAPFPPIITQLNPTIPIGHLRPLGFQKRADGPIDELSDVINPTQVHDEYLQSNKAVTFRQVLGDTPAMSKWEKDEYLIKKYGSINTTVTVKGSQPDTRALQHMKFKKFLSDYMYDDLYLSNTIPPKMLEEVPFPSFLSCAGFTDFLVEADLWMSSGGTSSPIHTHADHNFHCVMFGRKDFIIIADKHRQVFNIEEKYPNAGAGRSNMDIERINMYKYKNVGATPWTHSSLKAGDCILIPAGYLHQVRSHGRSISFSMLMAPMPDYKITGCNATSDRALTQADVTYIWTYVDGHRQLTNVKLNSGSLRHHLMIMMRNNDKLYFEQFQHFYNEALETMANRPLASKVFDLLDPVGHGYIGRQKLENISPDILEEVATIFNKKHETTFEHYEL